MCRKSTCIKRVIWAFEGGRTRTGLSFFSNNHAKKSINYWTYRGLHLFRKLVKYRVYVFLALELLGYTWYLMAGRESNPNTASLLWLLLWADLKPRVGPRSHFEETSLHIVWKVFNIDCTRRFVNGWRLPNDDPVIVNCGLRHQCDLIIAIRTVICNNSIINYCWLLITLYYVQPLNDRPEPLG